MTKTDELIFSIKSQWDKQSFKSLNATVGNSIKALTAASAAAAAATAAIFAMGKTYAESTDLLIKTAERANTTTQSLQKLSFAAQDNGSSMDAISSSLMNLNKAQEELLRGKGDFEAWGRLGVNPSQYTDTSDLLLDIADRVRDLSTGEAIDLMSRVGINPELLQTLKQGKKGLQDLGNELEILGSIDTEDMKKTSQDFMSGWNRTSNMLTGVYKKIQSDLLKNTINPALQEFNKWFSKNGKQVMRILNQISKFVVKTIGLVADIVTRLAQPFIQLNDLVGGLKNSLILLGGIIVALKAKMVANMLIMAASMAPLLIKIGLIYLAFDELMSFFSGKDSILGDFVKKATEEIKALFETLKKLWDMISNFKFNFPSFDNIFGGTSVPLPIGAENRTTTPDNTVNNANTINLNINGGNIDNVENKVRDILDEYMTNTASRIGR